VFGPSATCNQVFFFFYARRVVRFKPLLTGSLSTLPPALPTNWTQYRSLFPLFSLGLPPGVLQSFPIDPSRFYTSPFFFFPGNVCPPGPSYSPDLAKQSRSFPFFTPPPSGAGVIFAFYFDSDRTAFSTPDFFSNSCQHVPPRLGQYRCKIFPSFGRVFVVRPQTPGGNLIVPFPAEYKGFSFFSFFEPLFGLGPPVEKNWFPPSARERLPFFPSQ